MEYLAAMFSDFPTEVVATPIVMLIYILRQIQMNRKCVTVADLLLTERKLERTIQHHADTTRDRQDALRREFDDKLQNLRNELGGY